MKSCGHNSPQVTVPRAAGVFSAILGLFVLAGWALGISRIKSVLPGAVEMKANTAIGLLLTGIALCLLDAQPMRRRSRIGQTLALSAALLGFATAGEYLFGWQLGIDEFLFRDTVVAYNLIRGRMSPYSAVVFTSIGLGLAALPVRALRWLVWVAATLTLLIGGMSFIGYVWNASELVTDRFLPPVAVHTAIAFILLGTGTLIASVPSVGQSRGMLASLSSVETKTLAGFLATLFLLLLAGGHAYRSAVATEESAQWAAHTQQVRISLGRLYGAVSDAESEQRDYLLSGNRTYFEESMRHAGESIKEAESLARLVADNPAQMQKLRELHKAVSERLASLERTSAVFEQSGLAAAKDRIAGMQGRQFMGSIRSVVEQMDSAEEELLTAREARSEHDKVKTLLSLLVTLAAAVAGFLVLFSGIRREMTTRALSEQRLKERTFQLEEANKEMEAFSYSVSHDLRAPLRHIEGYASLLRRATNDQLSDKAKGYLESITCSSTEMGQLIDGLLAVSRLGTVEMREIPVSLAALVQTTLRSLEMDTKDRKIAWLIAPLPEVIGDPSTLKQVLANLMGNAVKYTRDRNPAEIEIGCAGEETGRTIFFVRDNGAGFDMEHAGKLFGVFQRLHTDKEFEGTGIGLATAQRIIARHGGRIWADAGVDQGATFYFTLKRAAEG